MCVIAKEPNLFILLLAIMASDFVQAQQISPISFSDSSEVNSNITTDADTECTSYSIENNTCIDHVVKIGVQKDADLIQFFLFNDPKNSSIYRKIPYNSVKLYAKNYMNPNASTVFIIHGFWKDSNSAMPTTIKNAYLNDPNPRNIILVNWGELSRPRLKTALIKIISYLPIIGTNIPVVGTRLAKFIEKLVDKGFTSLDRIHLVGHSLGAHISGFTGAWLKSKYGRAPARITGLDPAAPFFERFMISRPLSKEDAEFVDIYHTAAGTQGFVYRNQGHADFFPNGGYYQPGCLRKVIGCSHAFAFKIFAASISKKFTACKCQPWFVYGPIPFLRCPGWCRTKVAAGEYCPKSARGQFYFTTSADPLKG